ncbi:acetyltransf_18 domain-containing protein, partial [Nephila pilipes]
DDVCVGFGIVKRNNLDVACVGPLYSDDPLVGEVMFRKLLEAMPNVKGLTMSTISSNSSANEWFKRLEIPIHDNLFRIYTKQKMLVNTRKIFAQLDVNFSPF